jgi:hypothetical protein
MKSHKVYGVSADRHVEYFDQVRKTSKLILFTFCQYEKAVGSSYPSRNSIHPGILTPQEGNPAPPFLPVSLLKFRGNKLSISRSLCARFGNSHS